MGATEEQMDLVAGSGLDHVSYILILYSLAFLLFLFVNILIHVYDRATGASAAIPKPLRGGSGANGRVRAGDTAGVTADERQLRDAEEFELDGLMSDDEDEELASRRKLLREDGGGGGSGDDGLGSPSTIGRNSDRVAR